VTIMMTTAIATTAQSPSRSLGSKSRRTPDPPPRAEQCLPRCTAQIFRCARAARNGGRCNSVATVSPSPTQPTAAKTHAGHNARSCSGWPRTVAHTENARAPPTAMSRIPNLRHAPRVALPWHVLDQTAQAHGVTPLTHRIREGG
jgi:hypothetical protein